MGIAGWIGGFVRWLLKGCKTKLRDETWLGDEIENYVIGIVTVVIMLGVAVWLFF